MLSLFTPNKNIYKPNLKTEIFNKKFSKFEHTNLLGLYLDANLSWKNYVQAF